MHATDAYIALYYNTDHWMNGLYTFGLPTSSVKGAYFHSFSSENDHCVSAMAPKLVVSNFRDPDWKFFFNLAGSELPLMPIDDIEKVLSRVPANEV